MLRVARRAVRGQSPMHGRGERHLGEFGVVLVVEVLVGGFVEQDAGPFGVLAGERLGERDEVDGDRRRHADCAGEGESLGRDRDCVSESSAVTQRRRGSSRDTIVARPSWSARRLRSAPSRNAAAARPTRPSTPRLIAGRLQSNAR